MQEICNKIFSLIHITSNSNYNSIMSSKGFIPSIHDEKNKKIQWLGDGVYFWDINDDDAIRLGKNLVFGKFKRKNIVGIVVQFEVDKSKIINFDNENWNQKYLSFLKKVFPIYYKEIIDYMEIIESYNKVSIDILNRFGAITGKTINLFLDYLYEQENIVIELVSGYFYHQVKTPMVLGRKYKMIQQFCVKDINLVNKCIDNWKIIHNI